MPRPLPRSLASLIDDQHGVVARRQLAQHGVGWDRAAVHVDAGRWCPRTPRVLSTTTGQPTLEQRQWTAVLHAGPGSQLTHLSAAARHGLQHWDRPEISVLVAHGLSFEPVPGVAYIRTRRPMDDLRSPRSGVPTCLLEPAVLMWAAGVPQERSAHGVVLAVVQQRLTTTTRLEEWLDRLAPLRRSSAFRDTVRAAAGGAHSGAEADVSRLCRRFGLEQPVRQTARRDRDGRRRWTDAEWRLPDGRILVLEVDGSFHLEVRQAADDARRSRRLSGPDLLVVRCTAFELRHEPDEVAVDLIALGVPRVRGSGA